MDLSELLKHLNKLAEDKDNLDKEVMVTGCYASSGDIYEVYIDRCGWVILQSDICSG